MVDALPPFGEHVPVIGAVQVRDMGACQILYGGWKIVVGIVDDHFSAVGHIEAQFLLEKELRLTEAFPEA